LGSIPTLGSTPEVPKRGGGSKSEQPGGGVVYLFFIVYEYLGQPCTYVMVPTFSLREW
jgi:hypothetical protein